MPTPTITPLPALDRTSPTFRGDVDLFFGSEIPTFSTQINVLADDLTKKSAEATAAAALATESISTVTAAVTATAASASAASGSSTAAAGSATAAAGSATTAGTKAVEAETARVASVTAKTAAEAAAATALTLRNQTQVLHDDTVAVAVGDILGTAPDKFSNNATLDVKLGALEDEVAQQIEALTITEFVSVTGTAIVSTPGPLYVFQADTTGAELKLPITPPVGTQISFSDISLMRTNSIDPQGAKIRGAAGKMLISLNNVQLTLRYTGATMGWI